MNFHKAYKLNWKVYDWIHAIQVMMIQTFLWKLSCIYDTEIRIIQDNSANTIAAHALAPCVVRSSANLALTTKDIHVPPCLPMGKILTDTLYSATISHSSMQWILHTYLFPFGVHIIDGVGNILALQHCVRIYQSQNSKLITIYTLALYVYNIDGLMQERHNSSSSAM